MKKLKLTIELVPRTSWYDNVRSKVTKVEWDKIRKAQYKKAGYKCEICGTNGVRLDCHEIWHYNDEKGRQILIGFVAICEECHKVKHIGRSMMMGQLNDCIKHLMKVNDITEEEALEYIDDSFAVWDKRNKRQWVVDINYLELLADKGE